MDLDRHEKNWLYATNTLAEKFSTCSRRQYMAVVLAPNKRVLGIGYNGSPSGFPHCVDGGCPRGYSLVAPGSDYTSTEGFCIAQHAEAGALLWSDPALRQGGTLIVNGSPCMECARLIASSGISKVVCFTDPAYVSEEMVRSFFSQANILSSWEKKEDYQ